MAKENKENDTVKKDNERIAYCLSRYTWPGMRPIILYNDYLILRKFHKLIYELMEDETEVAVGENDKILSKEEFENREHFFGTEIPRGKEYIAKTLSNVLDYLKKMERKHPKDAYHEESLYGPEYRSGKLSKENFDELSFRNVSYVFECILEKINAKK